MEQMTSSRETLGSRLGFLLLSAGCAIGLGNIWRFPYITGANGGAIFVLIYLFFLIIFGMPIMVMELSIGRGGRSSLSGAYRNLAQAPALKKTWSGIGKIAIFGNLILLMFYAVVTGWLLSYMWDYLIGSESLTVAANIGNSFGALLGNWKRQLLFAAIAIFFSTGTCMIGLQSGVERITKILMGGLFIILIALSIYACTLSGAGKGLSFLFKPSLATITKEGGLWSVIHDAMAQAFFTLSLGIGSIAIFGSYIDKKHSLSSESIVIIILDTLVALFAGVIIFPCCFTYNIEPGAGPGLLLNTLPQAFVNMPQGRLIGVVFFLFLSIAALTTLIAVAENIIAFIMDEFKVSRTLSSAFTSLLLLVTSLPCNFGFNIWSKFQPFGEGSCVLDLEDFIVSDNLLPLGSLAIVLFCTRKLGWGFENFLAEANRGTGIKMPSCLRFYLAWILPVLIFALWVVGIYNKLF